MLFDAAVVGLQQPVRRRSLVTHELINKMRADINAWDGSRACRITPAQPSLIEATPGDTTVAAGRLIQAPPSRDSLSRLDGRWCLQTKVTRT